MRIAMALGCLLVIGCQTDFLGYGGPVTTTTPTAEQIAYCREVMYIRPELEIQPLGYFLRPGIDDVIRLKFIATTDDPSLLFDDSQVDASSFSDNFDVSSLDLDAVEPWWDVSDQILSGGSFTVPPPNAPGGRGLNIGYFRNEEGTLTVYVLWHET